VPKLRLFKSFLTSAATACNNAYAPPPNAAANNSKPRHAVKAPSHAMLASRTSHICAGSERLRWGRMFRVVKERSVVSRQLFGDESTFLRGADFQSVRFGGLSNAPSYVPRMGRIPMPRGVLSVRNSFSFFWCDSIRVICSRPACCNLLAGCEFGSRGYDFIRWVMSQGVRHYPFGLRHYSLISCRLLAISFQPGKTVSRALRHSQGRQAQGTRIGLNTKATKDRKKACG
jgi:hypothetical protein